MTDPQSSKDIVARLRTPRTTVGPDVSPEEAANEIERTRAALHDAEARAKALHADVREWIAANGPGGWIDNLRKRAAHETPARLGMDTPWPLPDVLGKLIEATEHLLGHHGCDTHGHEEFRTAANRGREYLTELKRSAQETSECPACLAGREHDGPCENAARERLAAIALKAAGQHAERVVELEAEVSTLREHLAEVNRLLSLNVAEVERLRRKCPDCGADSNAPGWNISHDCTAVETTVPPVQRVLNTAGTASYEVPQFIETDEDGSPLKAKGHPDLVEVMVGGAKLTVAVEATAKSPTVPNCEPGCDCDFCHAPPVKALPARFECTCLPSGRETCRAGGPPFWTMCKTCGGAVNGKGDSSD